MVQLFPTTYSMAETHSYSTLDDDEIEVNYVYMQFSKILGYIYRCISSLHISSKDSKASGKLCLNLNNAIVLQHFVLNSLSLTEFYCSLSVCISPIAKDSAYLQIWTTSYLSLSFQCLFLLNGLVNKLMSFVPSL